MFRQMSSSGSKTLFGIEIGFVAAKIAFLNNKPTTFIYLYYGNIKSKNVFIEKKTA